MSGADLPCPKRMTRQQKESYQLTEDEERYLISYAYEHEDFTDEQIVGFIDGMRIAQRKDLKRHALEMKKTVTSLEQVLKRKYTMDMMSPTSALKSYMISLMSDTGAGIKEDKNPALKEHITIEVLQLCGINEFFRIKRDTPLKNLMKVFCDRMLWKSVVFVFIFDGRRLCGDETPDELKMEDGAILRAWPSLKGEV